MPLRSFPSPDPSFMSIAPEFICGSRRIGHPAEVDHGSFRIAGQRGQVDRLIGDRDDQSRHRIAFVLPRHRTGQIENFPLTADVCGNPSLLSPRLRSLFTGRGASRFASRRVRPYSLGKFPEPRPGQPAAQGLRRPPPS